MAEKAKTTIVTLVSTYDFDKRQFRLFLWQGEPTQLDFDVSQWFYKIIGNYGHQCWVMCRDKKLPEHVARTWLRGLYSGDTGHTYNLTTGNETAFQ